MSSHFSYEIDERNLRVQLKNLEMPFRDEAWGKFEGYASAHQLEVPRRSFKPLEINLSRNIVLPVVFAVIIIFFSFILYSFVDISDEPESAESALVQPAVEPVTEPVAATDKANTAIPAVQQSPVKEVLSAEKATVTESTAKVETAPQRSEALLATPEVVEPAITEPVVQKKRQRRNREEEEAISAIRPTVVSEEETPVEIPQQ